MVVHMCEASTHLTTGDLTVVQTLPHSLNAESMDFLVPHPLDSKEVSGTIAGSTACSDYPRNLKEKEKNWHVVLAGVMGAQPSVAL